MTVLFLSVFTGIKVLIGILLFFVPLTLNYLQNLGFRSLFTFFQYLFENDTSKRNFIC